MIKKNFKNIFLILSGFQITWLSCIFGEIYKLSYLGLIIGSIYLIIYFFFINNKYSFILICIFFSIPGYFFDTFMSYQEYYYIKSESIIGYLPSWFIILWPSFTTLLYSVFNFLREKLILSIFLGAFFGPLTYYSGIVLNIAFSNNLLIYLIFLSIFWSLLMLIYSLIIKKFDE